MRIVATPVGARFLEPLNPADGRSAVLVDQCVRMDELTVFADNDNLGSFDAQLRAFWMASNPGGKQGPIA